MSDVTVSVTRRRTLSATLEALLPAALAGGGDRVWLDSAIGDADRGRRSLLALETKPALWVDVGGVLRTPLSSGLAGDGRLWTQADAAFYEDRARHPEGLGWVGYLAYEAGALADAGLPDRRAALPFPALRFDRITTALVARGDAVELVATREDETACDAALDTWERELSTSEPLPRVASLAALDVLDRAHHEACVARVREEIAAGNVYQTCYTFPLRFARPPSLADAYLRLRRHSPGDFGAYLRMGDLEAASTSPERFVRIDGDRVVCRPMKGTRPRDPDPVRDSALAEELGSSAKDRAENVMIVDLMRNDLGRVCVLGSVHVPQLFEVEHYETVHQMTSTVAGTLREGVGPFGVLEAVFPPGSMTGAPKVAACRLIDELEPEPRGLYSGTIAWLGFDGTCELSVVIRTLQAWGDTARWNVGGGIVWDSTPSGEVDEALAKAAALRAAGLWDPG